MMRRKEEEKTCCWEATVEYTSRRGRGGYFYYYFSEGEAVAQGPVVVRFVDLVVGLVVGSFVLFVEWLVEVLEEWSDIVEGSRVVLEGSVSVFEAVDEGLARSDFDRRELSRVLVFDVYGVLDY